MSLDLDKRQRAMLREMGVQVWWPTAEQAAPASDAAAQAAGPAEAETPAPAAVVRTAAPAPAPAPVQPAPAAPAVRAPEAARSPAPAATPAPQAAAAATSTWRVGQAQMLAGQDDAAAEQGPRWLLLAEGRQDELMDGAGQLLRNMLRAARLHQGAQVWMAPMQRAAGPSEVQGLDEVLERTEPDVVFIMSRLGAQALLETDEPLGRLRGQVHDLWGMPAVVSYDLGALMRTPMEKAKAWDDLCLALQVARAQHAERMDAQ